MCGKRTASLTCAEPPAVCGYDEDRRRSSWQAAWPSHACQGEPPEFDPL